MGSDKDSMITLEEYDKWRLPDDNVNLSELDPQVVREYFRRVAELTPEERVHLSMELGRREREQALAGIRERHPEYTEEEVKLAGVRLA